MIQRETTSTIVDEVIRFGVTSAAIGSVLVLPGLAVALDKPLKKMFAHLDKKERKRQLAKTVYYMKQQGYLVGDYAHGLQITSKARQRYVKSRHKLMKAKPVKKWDKTWRVVLYDIPEHKGLARRTLQSQLRVYGFRPLQKSVYVTPFDCLEDIEMITTKLGVDTHITYFEAKNLANEGEMLRIFRNLYPETKF